MVFFYPFCVQVEKELKDICNDILDVLDKHLIPAACSGESKVFYYKMYVPQNIYNYNRLIQVFYWLLCTTISTFPFYYEQ